MLPLPPSDPADTDPSVPSLPPQASPVELQSGLQILAPMVELPAIPTDTGSERVASFPEQAEDPFAGPLTAEDHFSFWLDNIANALAGPGYIVLDELLPEHLSARLLQTLEQEVASHLQVAGIGRGDDFQLNRGVRRDKIHWLEAENPQQEAPAVTEFLHWMDKLREGLNRRLFLGLFEYECHFAVYEPGDFYQKHLDAFKGRPGRKLSTVLYLNDSWSELDGGELVLYDEAGAIVLERVAPKGGRLVIFLSEDFPHEVLAAKRKRCSIAGWFRVNPL